MISPTCNLCDYLLQDWEVSAVEAFSGLPTVFMYLCDAVAHCCSFLLLLFQYQLDCSRSHCFNVVTILSNITRRASRDQFQIVKCIYHPF